MLKIKLSPTGMKHHRHFRIIVTEKRSKLVGNNVAVIGHFHPTEATNPLSVDKDLYTFWIQKGAQPTAKVKQLVK